MHKKLNFKHHDDALKKSIQSMYAYDLALLFPRLDIDDQKRLLHLIDVSKLADVFVALFAEDQQDLFELLTVPQQKTLLKNLESDDLKEFIEDIDEDQKEEILKLLPIVKQKAIRLLLTYTEDLAASIMSTDFITITQDMTIKEATNMIVTTSKEQDYIDTIFVVDDEKKIVGFVDLKQLIMARGNQIIKNMMDDDYQFVLEDDTIERAIETVMDYDRNSIPVLNSAHHIIGIVTADDVFDEIVESTESDYHNMALLQDYESSSSAIKRSRQRLPWLMIAVVLNLLIASILSIFEATLAEVTALVLFQPLILGMAGNIGTQALAVTILGLHLEEFDSNQMPRSHVIKELIIGFMNSTLLAIAAFIFVTVFLTIIPTGVQEPSQIAGVVFVAVFSSMFISATLGVMIPLLLNKIGTDPSVASGPIMTTINDVVALVIYFGVATIAFL